MNPNNPFPGDLGLPPHLVPNPPSAIPEAPGPQDATAKLSPFTEEQDPDQIIAQLMIDRPLKLWIPDKEQYPEWEFRIINSIPQEIAAAQNKGFRPVTDPKLTALFDSLVAGTDKTGAAFRPLLFARARKVGEVVRNRQREQLRSLYAGMDPANKQFDSKYGSQVDKKDGTFLQREGRPWHVTTSKSK